MEVGLFAEVDFEPLHAQPAPPSGELVKKVLVVLAAAGALSTFTAAPASATGIVTKPGPGLIVSCPMGEFAPGQGVQDDLDDCN